MQISSKVEKAVIYRTGAFVTRSAEIHLLPGKHRLCFEKLPGSLVGETIQIWSSQELICNQVKYDAEYTIHQETKGSTGEKIQGQEQMRRLKERKAELEDELEVLEFSDKVVSKDIDLGSREDFSIENLRQYIDFMYQKQTEIREKKRNCFKEISGIDEKL